MVEPRQIVESLRDVEVVLQRFSGMATNELRRIEQTIYGVERSLEQRQTEIERESQQARTELSICLASGYFDENGNYHAPDCSAHMQHVYEIDQILSQIHRLIQLLNNAASQYRAQASQLEEFVENKVPAASYWLRERQQALERFERSGGDLGSLSGGVSYPKTSNSQSGFSDAKGRNLSIRVYDVLGDQKQIRVYDSSRTPSPSDHLTIGDAGMANLQFERNASGGVERVRLQDIQTYPVYQKSGVGSKVLDRVEAIGWGIGAKEIYGDAPSDPVTRQWYAKRGYGFRLGNSGGTEVFKKLKN